MVSLVVVKQPCSMAPTVPVVATDMPCTGTTLAGAGQVETSGPLENALGIAALLMKVVLVSSGRERCRVTSSDTQATN